jgi:predicted TIM-barrel fold metal-dependent hydrolase
MSQAPTTPQNKFDGAIDAHVHVWTPDTERWPLAEGFKKSDVRPPSFTPEELLSLARPNGVARIVLIQMSFYRFDNAYMLETMKRFPGVFSGVGIVDDQQPQPEVAMKQLAEQGVRGFRINAKGLTPDKWLAGEGMHRMWRAAGENGWAICPLINPDFLPAVDAMCAKHPDTTVVIDHFARLGVRGEVLTAEMDQLCKLARFKHTHVKTSAFYAQGKKSPPYLDVLPMIRRLRDEYGADRLMWATDCPFQVQNEHTYEASISLVRDHADFLSDAERTALLRDTAQRVFFS